MRICVCGGRQSKNSDLIKHTLNEIHKNRPITFMVQGGSQETADCIASNWATENSVPCHTDKPMWKCLDDSVGPVKEVMGKYGKYNFYAAHNRNTRILEEDEPDLVIIFNPDNLTADMKEKSNNAGVSILEITTKQCWEALEKQNELIFN